MHTSTLMLGMALVSASLAAQGSADKTLRGTVTIQTYRGAVAIHGKATPPAGDFLFCLDQDRSATAQKIDFSGPARVLYRAVPITGIPEGVTISGPENVANTLTVIADDGKAWVFVGKGQQPLPAAGDRALANATTVGVAVVRRLDWASGNGPRRGTDIAGCLQPAG